jgi:hypothetical protein
MPSKPWTVTGQEQVMAKDSTNRYVEAVRVYFVVGALGPFSVDVPQAGFDPATVSQLIDDYTAHIVAVAGLGG